MRGVERGDLLEPDERVDGDHALGPVRRVDVRIDEQLEHRLGHAAASARRGRAPLRQVAAGAVTADRDPGRVPAQVRRVAQAPLIDREGIVERLRERVLRREPVVDVHDDAVGRCGQGRAHGLEVLRAEQHEAAAVEVDQDRQRFVRPARRADEARDVAVRSRDRHRLDAGHLDRRRAQRPVTCARPGPDLLERRWLVRLGLRGHGVEHVADLWVEWGHAGAACRGAGTGAGLGGAACVDRATTARNSARTADTCPPPARASHRRGPPDEPMAEPTSTGRN